MACNPTHYGVSDAAGAGMGGVYFNEAKLPRYYLWQQAFLQDIKEKLVSWDNPSGCITNSDLELAATIAQHNIMACNLQITGQTVFTGIDNTPALYWQCKWWTTTTKATVYLLHQQALHQRHHCYHTLFAHIAGKQNMIADATSH